MPSALRLRRRIRPSFPPTRGSDRCSASQRAPDMTRNFSPQLTTPTAITGSGPRARQVETGTGLPSRTWTAQRFSIIKSRRAPDAATTRASRPVCAVISQLVSGSVATAASSLMTNRRKCSIFSHSSFSTERLRPCPTSMCHAAWLHVATDPLAPGVAAVSCTSTSFWTERVRALKALNPPAVSFTTIPDSKTAARVMPVGNRLDDPFVAAGFQTDPMASPLSASTRCDGRPGRPVDQDGMCLERGLCRRVLHRTTVLQDATSRTTPLASTGSAWWSLSRGGGPNRHCGPSCRKPTSTGCRTARSTTWSRRWGSTGSRSCRCRGCARTWTRWSSRFVRRR